MKKKQIPNIFEISDRQALKILLKSLKEFDSLWEEHCENTEDDLSLLLKSHLVAEHLLEEILNRCMPNPKTLLKKSSFSYKILLLEALNIMPGENIYRKLKTFNMLRNDAVHALFKEYSEKKVKRIDSDLGLKPHPKKGKELRDVCSEILDYLSTMKIIVNTFPLISVCRSNDALFAKDKSYKHFLPMLKIAFSEYRKIIKYMKL